MEWLACGAVTRLEAENLPSSRASDSLPLDILEVMVVAMAEQVLGVHMHIKEMEPTVGHQVEAEEARQVTMRLIQATVLEAKSESFHGR